MNENKKFCIGVVLYSPPQSCVERLLRLLALGYVVYCYDNTPSIGITRNRLATFSNFKYHSCADNVGLAIGISTICDHAYHDGHQRLLFFDQDTVFTQETIRSVEKFITECQPEDPYRNYSTITFREQTPMPSLDGKTQVAEVLLTINSGSLFNLASAKTIKFMNKNLFVDCVDYDFCFRSHLAGFKIGEIKNVPGLDHSSEQGDATIGSGVGKIKLRRYPLWRIRDSISASLRIFMTAAINRNIRFSFLILKSVIGYIVFQIMARIIRK